MTKNLILFLTIILIHTYAYSKEDIKNDCTHSDRNFKCVKFIRNYDGDTITVNIPNVPTIIGEKMGIRIKNIDTPEIRGKNNCEKTKASEAKKIVYNHLVSAKNINLLNCIKGKYFRFVCDVYADEKNISDILLNKKLAYKYQGGKKRKIDWCTF